MRVGEERLGKFDVGERREERGEMSEHRGGGRIEIVVY